MPLQNLILRSLACSMLLLLFSTSVTLAEEKRKLDPEKDKIYEHVIKPILSSNCTTCHGSSKAKGKIRLHNPEEIKKSGNLLQIK